MRINKTTTVGAVAACAVIGATSPVWADSGSGGTADNQATAAQQAAVINALKAEVAKLKTELTADDNALHAATKAAAAEARALAQARAAVAHWKSVAENAKSKVRTVTVPVPAKTTAFHPASYDPDKARDKSFDPRHHCRHSGDRHFGDRSGSYDPGHHNDSESVGWHHWSSTN